ncbi:MAG: hypothetical protein ABJ327_25940 [Litoreibacter sp.]
MLGLIPFLAVLLNVVNGFNNGVFGIGAENPLIILIGITACLGFAYQAIRLTQLRLDRALQLITATRWTIFGRKTEQYSMTDKFRADVDENMGGPMKLFARSRLGFVYDGTTVDPIWLWDIGDVSKPHNTAHIINRWVAGRAT